MRRSSFGNNKTETLKIQEKKNKKSPLPTNAIYVFGV